MIHFLRISPRRWIYFGHEDEVPHAKVWEQFWFIEENPPYRIGNGWRMREGRDVAFHIGVAVSAPAVSSDLEILGGFVIDVPPHELGQWGAEIETADDAGENPSEVGAAEYARVADLH